MRPVALPFFGFCLALCLLGGCSDPTTPALRLGHPTNKTYQVKGVYYTPQKHYELCQEGLASHYGGRDDNHGDLTALGGRFNMFAMTAAHKTLPLPCMIHVENLENGRSCSLLVNDRGPYVDGRILDVSSQAAKTLGFYRKGLAKVRLTTLVPESLKLASRPNPEILPCRSVRWKKPEKAFFVGIYCLDGKAKSLKTKMAHFGQPKVRFVKKRPFVCLGPFYTLKCAMELWKNMNLSQASIVSCAAEKIRS